MMRSDLNGTPQSIHLNPAHVRLAGGPLPPAAPLPRRKRTPVSQRRTPAPGEHWREEEHWEAIADHACRLYFPNEG